MHYVLLSQCSFEKPAYVRIVNVISSTKMGQKGHRHVSLLRMRTEQTVTFEPNSTSSEKLRVGLKVLANVLKAAINADLSANTGALRWQGAMTHRLEVGAGLGKKIRTDGGRGRHLSNGRETVSNRFLVGRAVP